VKIRRLIDTGEWTTRRYLSLLGTILIWIIVAIDAWYLWPTQLGGDTSIVVVSGESMEPTYFGGDMVIARKMEPSVGDAIIYAPEGLGGSQVVHRIIGGDADEGWQMQGDNNSFIDPFTPKGDEVKGVVLVHYSNFGRVTVLLLNPMVWAFVLLAAMVLMLWYTGDDCEDKDDDDDENNDIGEDDGDPEAEAEYEPDLIDRAVEGTEAALARMVASGAAAGTTAFALLTRPSPQPRHAAPVPIRTAPAYLRGSAVVAVLGLLAVVGPSIASASQLTINTSDQASVMTVEKCDNLSLTASPTGSSHGNNYTQVQISGLTAACANRPITVSVYASGGGPTQTASGTWTTDPQTFVVQEYKSNWVDTVIVKIDGWLYVASYSR